MTGTWAYRCGNCGLEGQMTVAETTAHWSVCFAPTEQFYCNHTLARTSACHCGRPCTRDRDDWHIAVCNQHEVLPKTNWRYPPLPPRENVAERQRLPWWERSFLVHCLWRWTGGFVTDLYDWYARRKEAR